MISGLPVRVVGASFLGLVGWRLGILAGDVMNDTNSISWGLSLTLAGMVLGAVVTPYVFVWPFRRVLTRLSRVPLESIMAGALGLTTGLVVAALLSVPIARLPGWVGDFVPLILSLAFGYVGTALFMHRGSEFVLLFFGQARASATSSSRDGKILVDTSAIIDGRIADITQTGFVQGTLIIPRFVLDELRHIADSADSMRRTRGRRGLEMLNRLRKEANVPVQVLDVDVRNGTEEVDGKLVQLAKDLKASIITTDFNLNRVAELQGVKVLNINQLVSSLKPVVLPGEEMGVLIVQEGKEAGQGVGFLDDGTMVVVEGGRRYINNHLDVVITRVLQTAAGRIIFAQLKGPA